MSTCESTAAIPVCPCGSWLPRPSSKSLLRSPSVPAVALAAQRSLWWWWWEETGTHAYKSKAFRNHTDTLSGHTDVPNVECEKTVSTPRSRLNLPSGGTRITGKPVQVAVALTQCESNQCGKLERFCVCVCVCVLQTEIEHTKYCVTKATPSNLQSISIRSTDMADVDADSRRIKSEPRNHLRWS